MNVDVSIAMLPLNEAPTLPKVIETATETLRELGKKGFTGEFTVPDSGSTDGSHGIARYHLQFTITMNC